MNGNGLVNANYYNPAQLFNRVGQVFYRTGDVSKAKLLFILAGIYDGKFKIENKIS